MANAIEKTDREVRGLLRPSSLLEDLRREFTSLWETPWSLSPSTKMASDWWPRIDVVENKGMMMVKADLPGMRKKDVDVSVKNGDLILRGERTHESKSEEDNVFRSERWYGNFRRHIPLNFEVDPDAIKAKFKDGVLEVSVPLPEESQQPAARRIEIN